MSAACKYRPLDVRMVWTFIVSRTFPLDLRDAESLCVELGQSKGTRRDTAIQCSNARVQRGEMQRITFTKMHCLVREMPGFASKAVMNFKIPGVIHRCWPFGRCARHAECEYFPVYLTPWSPNASTVLSLHFETDTGLYVLQQGRDRGAFSLPETSSPRVLLRATDLRRIALFSGLLNPAPISGNVPYLFG